METIEISRHISASPEVVWKVLDDFRGIERWSPGIKRARLLTDGPTARGTIRHCDFVPFGSAKERVEDYQPERRMAVSLFDISGMPFDRAAATFDLAPDTGGTRLTFRYTFHRKWAARLAGPLLSWMLGRGLAQLVDGLQNECEAGRDP